MLQKTAEGKRKLLEKELVRLVFRSCECVCRLTPPPSSHLPWALACGVAYYHASIVFVALDPLVARRSMLHRRVS